MLTQAAQATVATRQPPLMALRLLTVRDVFTDQGNLDHCGLVILSEREDSEQRELPIITVPRCGARSEGEPDRHLFWPRRLRRVEHSAEDKEIGLVCFHFTWHKESPTTRNSVYISFLDLLEIFLGADTDRTKM